MAQTGEVSTTGVRRGASKFVATAILLTCLVLGVLVGFSGANGSNNLRAQQAEKDNSEARISPLSAPANIAAADEKSVKPQKIVADPKNEHVVKAGDSSVGAWGPNDFEKDDWKSLFGADKAAGGSALTFNQLMAIDDGGDTLSFSYEFVDTDGESWFA